MTILNRVALGLKTVSEPITSRLKLKFQQFLIELGEMKQAEKNRAKVGRLDEECGSFLPKCILTMIGIYFINDYREWYEREKKRKARWEACEERERKYEAQKLALISQLRGRNSQ